jgi:hypothetical protein
MRRFLATGVVAALLVAPGVGGAAQVRVQNVDGTFVDPLAALPGVKAIVLVFTSTDCPVSNRYAPEVQRIVAAFSPRGVAFRLVYPNPAEDATAIRKHMAEFSYTGVEGLRDPTQALARHVGATITPEAVVVVGGSVRYRGRIDDRYVELGVERPAPATHDLADALTAVLSGRTVAHPTTQAVGCYIADFAR